VRRTFLGWLIALSLAVWDPRELAESASSLTCPKRMMSGSM